MGTSVALEFWPVVLALWMSKVIGEPCGPDLLIQGLGVGGVV